MTLKSKIQKNIVKTIIVLPFLLFSNLVTAQTMNPGSSILDNPLKNINSIYDLIVTIAKLATQVGASLAVVYFVLSGFKLVMAQGNPGELDKARKSFYHATIGTALILGAWLLATAIQSTIKSLGG
jgi:hypothetical protein